MFLTTKLSKMKTFKRFYLKMCLSAPLSKSKTTSVLCQVNSANHCSDQVKTNHKLLNSSVTTIL